MFLKTTICRNPNLISAGILFHQNGEIPPNTYLIDIEAVIRNAQAIFQAARAHGLQLYGMTKQQGRNPILARGMVAAGIQKAVVVDYDEARILHVFGIPIGHLGHLTQTPDHFLAEALSMQPEVVTVFSVEKAERIGEAARLAGQTQPILLRITDPTDYFFPAQEGGFLIQELENTIHAMSQIKGIRIAGVTAFPCLRFDYEQEKVVPTPNLGTVLKAAEVLQKILGEPVEQINGPGVSTSATMEMLASAGVTHAEPGSSLTGHTPLHAYSEQPEIPGMIYVSEVTHRLGGRIFTHGGGFYPRGRIEAAVVGRTPEQVLALPPIPALSLPAEAIDYYGELVGSDDDGYKVGDTAIYAFRSQVFCSRSYVAVATGISENAPKLLGLFDQRGNPLDQKTRLPLDHEKALELVDNLSAGLQPGKLETT